MTAFLSTETIALSATASPIAPNPYQASQLRRLLWEDATAQFRVQVLRSHSRLYRHLLLLAVLSECGEAWRFSLEVRGFCSQIDRERVSVTLEDMSGSVKIFRISNLHRNWR